MNTLCGIAPELPASDLQASCEYYERQLGFKIVMTLPDRAYAIVERDAVAIHLFSDETRQHTPVGAHIFTHDLDVVYGQMRDRGAVFSQHITLKPWGNREFRLADPFGNELKFTELPLDA